MQTTTNRLVGISTKGQKKLITMVASRTKGLRQARPQHLPSGAFKKHFHYIYYFFKDNTHTHPTNSETLKNFIKDGSEQLRRDSLFLSREIRIIFFFLKEKERKRGKKEEKGK